jgi:aldehyde:ferredoxin oxidoreductase
MGMSIELIRESIKTLSEKIAKNPRVFEKQPFSMVQHVTDCEALIKEIEILNETLTQMADQYQWEMYNEIRTERTADEIQKYREHAIRELTLSNQSQSSR